MLLSSKEEGEILEKAVKEAEGLRDTGQRTIPRLRRSRIIIFDVPSDTEGREVIAAAAEQASVEVESMFVKFPMGGKDLTYWVIECAPSPFYKLLGLRRLVMNR